MIRKENFKKRYISFGVLAAAISLLALIFAFSSRSVDTESYMKSTTSTKKVEKKVAKSSVSSSDKKTKVEEKADAASQKEKEATNVSEEPATEPQVAPAPTTAEAQPQAMAMVNQQSPAQSQQYTTSATSYLANGNTAGVVGSQAAAQMAAQTGVPQATWEAIIARESNGNPNVANASGASGLFQTMPGWGSTATVQDQINAAVKAYNAQGLAAWGY
ncbi:transglycosylase SLT domain-containing protein [Streptococcus didelphis]|uniref:Transglycosylase SLT domain-containing protein n=1 Tax=Streptococcus didelphis TaxID=102886 RepID=A0ABY9LFF4_9STRE|nr:transglycosylase SLT domain-containing protein [Streptococcus didelphis]WMB27639.1 transglycosylase SLT domain-containing protein [Streptococcus didelphis]WMB29897.1 transglycosylase SLT domain-containing protein [Streptococcus didelphis]